MSKASSTCLLAAFTFFCLYACTADPREQQRQQYVSNGKLLYQQRCINCHKENGKGFGRLYPPLAGADFVRNRAAVVCAIQFGLKGEVTVNGTVYNLPMPANPDLTPAEVAQLATYILHLEGNDGGLVETRAADSLLRQCAK